MPLRFTLRLSVKKIAIVLLPGQAGSGKTRLSLWYRTQGFELGTDEIATTLSSSSRTPTLALGWSLGAASDPEDLGRRKCAIEAGRKAIGA